MTRNVFVLVALVLAAEIRAVAGVPESICVQGYLQTVAGDNVDGPVDFCVAVFDAPCDQMPCGGNQVWPLPPDPCMPINGILVENGLFALTFGDSPMTPVVVGNPGNDAMAAVDR